MDAWDEFRYLGPLYRLESDDLPNEREADDVNWVPEHTYKGHLPDHVSEGTNEERPNNNFACTFGNLPRSVKTVQRGDEKHSHE